MKAKRKRKTVTRPKATRPKRERKKKPPVGKPKKPTGGGTSRGRTKTRDSRAKVSPKKPARVKPAPSLRPKARAAVKKTPPRKPARKLPPLSRHPEAARSRRRRGLARERERIEELKREERNRKRRERRQPARRKEIDLVTLARGWLEMIHMQMSQVFGSTLEIVEPGGGAARPEDKDRQSVFGEGNSMWMICGRFDPTEVIGYQQLAMALALVQDDLFLEAAIHPERLSQLRIMFEDPSGKRVAEGDDVLSHIGGWTFVLGDAIGDLVGADPDAPGEDSFAGRYANTTVRVLYIFFSREIVAYRTAPGFVPRTQEIKLR